MSSIRVSGMVFQNTTELVLTDVQITAKSAGCTVICGITVTLSHFQNHPFELVAFKEIRKRQETFCKNGADSHIFKFYRNAVNRERKSCKAKYYDSKIQQMKGENPNTVWWKEVKRISGMSSRKI